MTGFFLSSAGLRVLVPRRADCAVLHGGVGGCRGRVMADWPRGAVAGRQVKAAQGGWRFFKVGVEMR